MTTWVRLFKSAAKRLLSDTRMGQSYGMSRVARVSKTSWLRTIKKRTTGSDMAVLCFQLLITLLFLKKKVTIRRLGSFIFLLFKVLFHNSLGSVRLDRRGTAALLFHQAMAPLQHRRGLHNEVVQNSCLSDTTHTNPSTVDKQSRY